MEPGEKWRCLQEEALIPPDRLVIDLDPGDEYAAGERFR
jgi:DNA primase